MDKKLIRWLESVWYGGNTTGFWLVPFGWIYTLIVGIRRKLYRDGVLKTHGMPVPVVVFGNISVGGTGKTPLIIWAAEFLKNAGFRPGVISRGYGGKSGSWPQLVGPDSDSARVGDEALVIYRQTGCPLAVGPDRAAAAGMLVNKSGCNVILSDDGLQHYALARDFEIAVVDGVRRYGNGRCLPAGPLREPVARLNSVDMVICNGNPGQNEFAMRIAGDEAVNLKTGERKSLSHFQGVSCHALAGIGNPGRFFRLLEQARISFDARIFPDHHRFKAGDILYNDDRPVLMTEKDAVKCAGFAAPNCWYVPIKADPDRQFSDRFLELLREKING
ncbi:MAG: tetraacyldisaccharide 4'-kinase [Gammaproteobacteria bacterium]